MWIQSRQQRVCDLYFCSIALAAIDKLKGRLNSSIIYSALGSNSTLLFCFLHLSFVRKPLMCHTVECTFWNSFKRFCLRAFCSFQHQIFHSVRNSSVYLCNGYNLTFYVSWISSTLRSVGSFLESNLESEFVFVF